MQYACQIDTYKVSKNEKCNCIYYQHFVANNKCYDIYVCIYGTHSVCYGTQFISMIGYNGCSYVSHDLYQIHISY